MYRNSDGRLARTDSFYSLHSNSLFIIIPLSFASWLECGDISLGYHKRISDGIFLLRNLTDGMTIRKCLIVQLRGHRKSVNTTRRLGMQGNVVFTTTHLKH